METNRSAGFPLRVLLLSPLGTAIPFTFPAPRRAPVCWIVGRCCSPMICTVLFYQTCRGTRTGGATLDFSIRQALMAATARLRLDVYIGSLGIELSSIPNQAKY